VPVSDFPSTPNGKLDRRALRVAHDEADLGNEIASREPQTSTERVLAGLWLSVLGQKKIGVADNFFDLGGHSLLAVRLVHQINAAVGSRLGILDLFCHPTIEALAGLIENDRQGRKRREPVVSLRDGHAGPPAYFVGAGPAEYRIGQSIGGDHPVYAIELAIDCEKREVTERSRVGTLPTMEQLGARYAAAIDDHAGNSPCVIVGYSFLGKVAFETAHALQRAGGQVALVLLIETTAWPELPTERGCAARSLRLIWRNDARGATSRLQKLPGQIGGSWRVFHWLFWQVANIGGRRWRSQAAPRLSGLMDGAGLPLEWKLVSQFYRCIRGSFLPRPLRAPGILFRTVFPGEKTLPGFDASSGWRGLFADGLEVVELKGDHVSIVRDGPGNSELGRYITYTLDRAAMRGPSAATADPKSSSGAIPPRAGNDGKEKLPSA
jgi:thioesterase domain-containing protein